MSTVRIRDLAYVLATTLATVSSTAFGQLTEFDYSSGTTWHNAATWGGAGIPNAPTHVADLSQPLGANLSIGIGTTPTTVAGLRIGGTAGPVTTTVTGTGAGVLRFQNDFSQALANADFSSNGVVDGADFLIWQRNLGATGDDATRFTGDADASTTVDAVDLQIWEENFGLNATGLNGGIAQIITGNVVGSVNTIAAPIRLGNEVLQVIGGTDLTLDGAISWEGSPTETDNNALGSSLSVLTRSITVTVNGGIDLDNKEATANLGRLGLNTSGGSVGTLVVNGVISGADAVQIGVPSNGITLPLGTVQLNGDNTYTGSTWISRGNIVVNHPNALGTGDLRHVGPANQFGYNIIAGDDSLTGGELVLNNDMIIGQWQTFRGDNSIRLTGNVTQTNNRGVVNVMSDGATLTLSGRLDIWEDDEALEREFEIDGSGDTILSGMIRGVPDFDDEGMPISEPAGNLRIIRKSGLGALTISMAALGDNNHAGDLRVLMGNVHYANGNSLNQGAGSIIAYGGAVGIDTGVTGPDGAAFLSRINPESRGGLQLAASDAAASLNFTGALANAAGMTVAAPETGLTFTGSITPANATYGLGGGTGKLTLPNAQLTGSNSVSVRNGGEVELLGDNTYTGATEIRTRYASTHQDQAAADTRNVNGLYFEEVAPVLIVDDLADGGQNSSIGAASSDAANLLIHGSTLRYVGAGDSTNRLFTVGTGGATLDSSGTGAVMFTNTGSLGMRDVSTTITGTLNDFEEDPGAIYEVSDTRDIIIGMTVSDPQSGGTFTQPPCEPGGANCIPAGTTVTGISDDGTQVGISNTYPFVLKENTQLVFGAVDRELTLTGSNAGNNTIASVIGDSAAGSEVTVRKSGEGRWILTGVNTYTGETIVEDGILSITNAYLDDDSTVRVAGGAALNLNFAGTDVIDELFLDGVGAQAGLWGGLSSTATFKSPLLTGTGLLSVAGAASAALAAVPEPASVLLLAAATLCLPAAARRRRRGC